MIFYTPNIDKSQTHYRMPFTESAHAVKALRLKIGDALTLVDGRGTRYSARIVLPNSSSCEVEVVSTEDNVGRRPFRLHIGIAPTKNNDRLEWFVEKATEIGVDVITPVVCEHSERERIQPDRLVRVAIAAMKQSGKAFLPTIAPAVSFAEWLANCDEEGNACKMIAYCGDADRLTISEAYTHGSNACIAIGPEGDFSPEEIEQALAAGFRGITLGNSRLRTETAGMVACAIVNSL